MLVSFSTPAGAVELRRELSQTMAMDLPATLVFDYPSTAELTAALAQMLPEPAPALQSSLPKRSKRAELHNARQQARAEESGGGRDGVTGPSAEQRQPNEWRPPQKEEIVAQVSDVVEQSSSMFGSCSWMARADQLSPGSLRYLLLLCCRSCH